MNDELDRYLASLERSSRFNVIRTLKASDHETTELVELADGISAPGPYIRKRISTNAGIGQAYTRLYDEQQSGREAACVPHIYECFVTEDSLTVVMELVRGKTLADWIYEVEPSPAFAAHVFPKICDAVSELHEGFEPPIIHRDLKPSNVMMSTQGVKVIDFGIARTYREDADTDTRHFGTPSYAPPEQFGFGQTDERSDIYALGMLLYYCLTERTPTFSMLESEFEDDDVPIPMRMVISKATSFDPAMRYASAKELKAAFLEAIDETLVDTKGDAIEGEEGEKSAGNSTQYDAYEPQYLPPQGAPVTMGPHLSQSTTLEKPRIPEPLSIVWNVMVVLLWLLMIAACIIAAAQPTGDHVAFPPAILVLEYPICVGGLFTFAAYGLLYKRYLAERMPKLFSVTGKRSATICIIGVITMFTLGVIIEGVTSSLL